MSSTNSTVFEHIDEDIGLARLAKNDSELPRPSTDPTPPPLQVVNTDSTLPTHHVPSRTYVSPTAFNTDTENSRHQTIGASVIAASAHTTWLAQVKEYAPVAAVVVTIIGIIVGAVIAVTVKKTG